MRKKVQVEMELWRAIGVIIFTFIGIYQCLSWLQEILQ